MAGDGDGVGGEVEDGGVGGGESAEAAGVASKPVWRETELGGARERMWRASSRESVRRGMLAKRR